MSLETPALPSAEAALVPGSSGRLHTKPTLIPVFTLACFIAALACVLYGARTFPAIERKVLELALYPQQLKHFAAGAALFIVVAAAIEHWRRLRPPAVPTYLRINRALAYGIIASLAIVAVGIARDPALLRRLLFDTETLAIAIGGALVSSGIAYVGWLHPLFSPTDDSLPPYQRVVESLQDTYDFVLGIERPEDYKQAAKGVARWLILPAEALWTNILTLGGIGSGKTSAIAYPLLLQALSKYPADDARRPSVFILDLKGNIALWVYKTMKALGREKEFWVVSPGNQLFDDKGDKPLLDAKGRPVIPLDRFLKVNPIGGDVAGDLRSSALLEAISATNDGPKSGGAHEYFENIEGEFLSMTVQLFDVLRPIIGEVTLFDIWQFANDREKRRKFAGNSAVKGTPMELYFRTFEALKEEDQDKRISGLKAKLAKLASPTVQSTFCPKPDAPGLFPGFTELLFNRPGVIVFSVPAAIYTPPLTRILGIMFMRAFHAEAERRSSTQFRLGGGNSERLVMNVVDECWAFMNKGVASFTAVSREARTCSLFLSQSLDQIADSYRSTMIGNFRTKVLLSVNDPLTLKEFSQLFGEVKELSTSVSTSESLNDVRHGVYKQGVEGKQQGLSTSTSVSERTVKRFTEGDIQHLLPRRGILHLFDGEQTRLATAFEVAPWYRLTYHVLSPLDHPHVGCSKAGKNAMHSFSPFRTPAVGQRPAIDGFRCSICGTDVAGDALADIHAYSKAFPHLLQLSDLFGGAAVAPASPQKPVTPPPTPPATPASPGTAPEKAKPS